MGARDRNVSMASIGRSHLWWGAVGRKVGGGSSSREGTRRILDGGVWGCPVNGCAACVAGSKPQRHVHTGEPERVSWRIDTMGGAPGVEPVTSNRVVEEASWLRGSTAACAKAYAAQLSADEWDRWRVPTERHGASEVGLSPGKGSSSSKRRGGSAPKAGCSKGRPARAHRRRGASETVA